MSSDWEEVRLLACFEQMGLLTDIRGAVVIRNWEDYRCNVCAGVMSERTGHTGGRLRHAKWHLEVEGEDGPLARYLRAPSAGLDGGGGPRLSFDDVGGPDSEAG